jgi:internalin A
MQQCGICFAIRRGDPAHDIEPDYVAPDLLPRRGDPLVQRALEERWEDRRADAEARLTYELLPPGLMRTLISDIGEMAGVAAEYWRDGFYFYDRETRSNALVEQSWTQDWQGGISVQTRGGDAGALRDKLLELIERRHEMLGARPQDRAAVATDNHVAIPGSSLRGMFRDAARILYGRERRIEPDYEPSSEKEYFVSYAWGDETPEGREREAVVDRLCEAAEERGVKIIRDRHDMRFRDRISTFMDRIGRGERVYILLSDKYLRSPYCMHELFEVWRNCRLDEEEFRLRTYIWRLPCAKIRELEDRTQYLHHWDEQDEKIVSQVKKDGQRILAKADLEDSRRIETFRTHIPDLLRLVKDIARPSTFEEFVDHSFADLVARD